jgi:hypothetical protein
MNSEVIEQQIIDKAIALGEAMANQSQTVFDLATEYAAMIALRTGHNQAIIQAIVNLAREIDESRHRMTAKQKHFEQLSLKHGYGQNWQDKLLNG